MARKALGVKARFGVFKRDGFVCQYCGQTPPAVVLEVDHVVPISSGGTDAVDNLLTACFDCNRGKGAEGLHVAPDSVVDKTARIKERQKQMRAYEAVLMKAQEEREYSLDWVCDVFVAELDVEVTAKGRSSIGMFLEKLPRTEVIDAAQKACDRRGSEPDQAFKYFCGICWNKIKGGR